MSSGLSLLHAAVILLKLDLTTWRLEKLVTYSDSESNNPTAKVFFLLFFFHHFNTLSMVYNCLLDHSVSLQNGKFHILQETEKFLVCRDRRLYR